MHQANPSMINQFRWRFLKISARSCISGNVVSLYTKHGIFGNCDEIFNGRLAPVLVGFLIMAQDLPCHQDMARILGILVLLKWNPFESLVKETFFFRADQNATVVPCSLLWLVTANS